MNRFYFFLCFIFLFGKSYSQYNHLLHKPYAERAAFLIPFYQETINDKSVDSVKTFTQINAIETLAKKNKDDDLLLETQLMRIHYFYSRTLNKESFILSELSTLKELAEKKNMYWLLARIESLAALTCFNEGYNYELAFIHFQKLYNYILQIPKENFPDKQACFYQIASAHYFFSDIPNTIKYLQEGLNQTPSIANYIFTVQSANTLGLCYQELGKYDSANIYFQKAYEFADKTKKSKRAWEGISSGNIGNSYFLQRQYDKAKPLLQKDVDIAIEYSDWGLAVGSLIPLGSIALAEDKIPEAEKYLSQAKFFNIRSGQYKRWGKLYTELSKLEMAKGNSRAAFLYLDSAMVVKDSLARKFNTLNLLRAMQKVDLELHKAEIVKLNSEKRINIWERNLMIAGIFIAMGIVVFIYWEQKRKVQRKEAALQKANKELEDAASELKLFTNKIFENHSIIEKLQGQLGGVHIDALQQLQQSTILTDEEWESFRKLFEKIHAGYQQRLKDKLPDLSPGETRFMVLNKLKLSNKEMAAILGVGTDAIRQYRSRLRKKLNLTEEENLEELVETI